MISNFFINIRIDEYAGMDLTPELVTFPTLAVVPPNLVIADFAIDNEFGHHYIPKNETTTLTVRFQNLSIGKTDTAVLAFRRGQGFINDPDEVKYKNSRSPFTDTVGLYFGGFKSDQDERLKSFSRKFIS